MTQQENIRELLRLIQENPQLPIVPMVRGEISGDDYCYYMGCIGDVCVDEYAIVNGYTLFKSSNDVFDALEISMSRKEFEALPTDEEKRREFYDALPWKKAIIVFIEWLD